ATVNGTDWATLNTSNNVVALGSLNAPAYTTLPASGATAGLSNYLLTAAGTTSVTANDVNTPKLAPTAPGQILQLNGSLALTAGGLLFDNTLAGATVNASGTQYTIGAIPTVLATTVAASGVVNLTSGTTAGFYVGMPVLGNASIP